MARIIISTKLKARRASFMPAGVPKYVRCYDNGGETWDRYTVVYTGKYRTTLPAPLRRDYGPKRWFQYVGMSESPFHPQGFGQHGESVNQIDLNKWGFAPAIGRKNHLGTRIPFKKLPEDCRKLVIQDYRDIWSL
jgi:hypothetical protein